MTKKILLTTTLSALLLSFNACSDKKEQKSATATSPKLLALPHVSKAEVSKILDEKQAALVKEGFAIEKTADTYVLKLEDEQKARAYMFKTLQEVLPSSYAMALKEIEHDFIFENKGAFKGTNVTFNVVEDNEGAKVKVTLVALPTQLEQELDKEIARNKDTAAVAKQVKTLVANGAFSYTMSLTKEGKVTGVAIADIKEIFTFGSESIAIESKGLSSRFLSQDPNELKMQGFWNTFVTTFKTNSEGSGTFSMNNLGMDLDQKDRFNSTMMVTIGGIHFDVTKEKFIYDYEKDERKSIGNETLQLSVNAIELGTTTKSDAAFFDVHSLWNMQHIDVSEKSSLNEQSINIDGFSTKASITHLAKKPVEDLVRFFDTFSGTMSKKEQRQLANSAEAITQAGFSIAIDSLDLKAFAMKTAGTKVDIHDLHFAIKATLPKNEVVIDDFMQLLPLVEVSGQLAMNEAEYTTLKEKYPSAFAMLDQFKKVENGRVIFDATFKQGLLLINGKSLKNTQQ